MDVDFSNTGTTIDANRSWDGLLGMIQRDEFDSVAYVYRSDYFEVQPGNLITTGYPADVAIVMKKNASTIMAVELISLWLTSFDIITVSYVMISIFLFITVLAFASGPTFSVTTLLRNMSSNLRRSLFAISDQENFEAENESSRVAVLFFNLFLLFGIHGIMLGCLGADLLSVVSVVDYPIYESLNEFSNTSHVQPTVMKNLWLLPILAKTGLGSELWPLKQAVDADPHNNIVEVNWDNEMLTNMVVSRVSGEMSAGTRALIFPLFALELAHDIMCTLMAERMRDFVYSKQSFAQGVLAQVISFKADPVLRRVMEYFGRTSTETGLMQGMVRLIHTQQVASSMPTTDVYWLRRKHACLERFKWDTRGAEVFGIGSFAPFFELFLKVSGIALIVMIAEKCCKKIANCRKRKKTAEEGEEKVMRRKQRAISSRDSVTKLPTKTEKGNRVRPSSVRPRSS